MEYGPGDAGCQRTEDAANLREGTQPKPVPIDFQATLQALYDAGATRITLEAVEDEQPEQPAIEGSANDDRGGH